ncbi:DUF4350 domain-containing protein [Amycolatopsis cynarae]|uniref:DUF4350 domain-containing protein n=1 Tax=Amycolatopsis cynarae TaxID=2995223 RepID=A0ABY7AYM5_9PSEU|nr:DUF4350 domain-containing protein [Amycolatopsis sp. HUAS 11-8]WAL64820.1 DUF4350 domain-containing protein [Amycolatopsis sp. HUAS 11-8]
MTVVSPDARRVWRAARVPVFIALVLVFGCAVVVLASSGGSSGALDPASTATGGAQALAKVLERQGVRLVAAHDYGAAETALTSHGDATLLVTDPALVEPGRLAALRDRAGATVVVGPEQEALTALWPGVAVIAETEVGLRSPGCTLAPAVAAGDAVTGGLRYRGPGVLRSCYEGSLVQLPGEVTVLGTGAPLTNGSLAQAGDAALTMRLLGRYPTLVWYVPSPGDAAAGAVRRPLTELLPRSWLFGAIEVVVAAVLFALWRARRLGPVVTEPLPVAVRAAETVEGRARLYRRSRSAGHAAEILRRAALARLLPVLGLGPGAEPASVTAAIRARCGSDAGPLLYGPAPEDEAALVRFANELDRLEREVRGS